MKKAFMFLMIFAVGLGAAGSAEAGIFSYRLRTQWGCEGDSICKFSAEAFIIPKNDGTLNVVIVYKGSKEFEVFTNVSGDLLLPGDRTAYLEGFDIINKEGSEVVVALGRYKSKGGEITALNLKGGHVDPYYSEYGNVQLRFNRALTNGANKSGFVSPAELLDWLTEIYLPIKGFELI